MIDFYLVKPNPLPSQSAPLGTLSGPHVLCKDSLRFFPNKVWSFLEKSTFESNRFCSPWQFKAEEDIREELKNQQSKTDDMIMVFSKTEIEYLIEDIDNLNFIQEGEDE